MADPSGQGTLGKHRVVQLIGRKLHIELLPAGIAHHIAIQGVEDEICGLSQPIEQLGLDVGAVGEIVEDRDAHTGVALLPGAFAALPHEGPLTCCASCWAVVRSSHPDLRA